MLEPAGGSIEQAAAGQTSQDQVNNPQSKRRRTGRLEHTPVQSMLRRGIERAASIQREGPRKLWKNSFASSSHIKAVQHLTWTQKGVDFKSSNLMLVLCAPMNSRASHLSSLPEYRETLPGTNQACEGCTGISSRLRIPRRNHGCAVPSGLIVCAFLISTTRRRTYCVSDETR